MTTKETIESEWVEAEPESDPTVARALDKEREEDDSLSRPVRRPGRLGLTPEIVLPWVSRLQGNVSAIADALGTSRDTVYKQIRKSPELKAAIDSERERTLDNLEETLATQALNGNIPALIFALKTQGRARGYGDRVEVDLEETRERDAKRDAEYLAEVIAELRAQAGGTGPSEPAVLPPGPEAKGEAD